ncbi:MAG TPA: hypothetical protein VFP00_10685, partial [Burkholderiales bacterium]|nr:hypothetical protein [Burkholderiales bacterium]
MSEEPRKPEAADMPGDPELARLYRDAAHEEPPRHLDAAILAAARREAGAQPRPLEQPAGGTVSSRMKTGNVPPAASRYRRWHVPVALAAVLVLSVSLVTLLHREREEYQPVGAPGAPPTAQERPEARVPSPPASSSAPKAVPERRVEDARAVGPAEDSVRSAQPTQREEAAPAAAAEAEAPSGRPPSSLAAPQPRPRVPEEQAGTPAVPTADAPPERWGELIMALREQGKAAEADALLAEYRRRFPGQAVPGEWT